MQQTLMTDNREAIAWTHVIITLLKGETWVWWGGGQNTHLDDRALQKRGSTVGIVLVHFEMAISIPPKVEPSTD